MIRVPCPHCGPRNSVEFRHVGEPRHRPDPAQADAASWRAYLYERANSLGWVTETWYHTAGCRRFFKIERHTLTNETRSWSGRTAPAPDPAAEA